MTRFRGDRADFQTDAHIDAQYVPEPPTRPEPLPADHPIPRALRAAAIDAGLLHVCGCGAEVWGAREMAAHRGECAA